MLGAIKTFFSTLKWCVNNKETVWKMHGADVKKSHDPYDSVYGEYAEANRAFGVQTREHPLAGRAAKWVYLKLNAVPLEKIKEAKQKGTSDTLTAEWTALRGMLPNSAVFGKVAAHEPTASLRQLCATVANARSEGVDVDALVKLSDLGVDYANRTETGIAALLVICRDLQSGQRMVQSADEVIPRVITGQAGKQQTCDKASTFQGMQGNVQAALDMLTSAMTTRQIK